MSSNLKNRKKRNIRRVVMVSILVTALLSWFLFRQLGRDDMISVRVTELDRGDISSYYYTTAEIKPGDIVEHYTGVSQKVLAVRVSLHQQVQSGDILAILDQQELADQYEAAREARRSIEASLAEADAAEKASLNAAERDRRTLEQEISRLFTSLSASFSYLTRLAAIQPASIQIDTDLEGQLTSIVLESDPETLEQDIASLLSAFRQSTALVENPEYTASLDQLERELLKASAAAENVLGRLASVTLAGSIALPENITGQIGSLAGLGAVIQDPLTQAIAQEETARSQLEKSQPYIYAKTAGLVAQIHISPGDYTGVAALSPQTGIESILGGSMGALSQQKVSAFTLYDNTRPQAVFYAGRFDAGRLDPGMKVQYDYDGQPYFGEIFSKGRIAASRGAGQFESLDFLGDVGGGLSSEPQLEIKMDIKGPGLTYLVTGFWIDAEIEIAHAKDVLLLPAEAMRRELDLYYVFLVDDNGLAVRQSFVPGIQSDRFVEVADGLKAGDQIVVSPPSSLVDSMPVRVMPHG